MKPPRLAALDHLKELLDLVQAHEPDTDAELLVERLSEHLGTCAVEVTVLTEDVPGHRYVDYDIALEMLAARDPHHQVIGVGGGDMRYHSALADLLQNNWGPRISVSQPDLTSLPDSPTSERTCLGFGVRLFSFEGHPVAVLEREANERRGVDIGTLEVLCADRDVSARLLTELGSLATEHSVLRGQVITLKQSGYEHSTRGITFVPRPQVRTEDVILPPGTLDRIKQHVLGIAEHAEQLRALGQHLKRGVLLYGPPGTGKTHTLRHLISEATEHTVILLSGTSLDAVGLAARIARALQPAVVVLEDVDLVAEDRDSFHGAQPMLFEVMDAMDGLDGDADVIFLLTTNRVESMEHALTQRPGRIDLAVEVPLPDRDGRIALLNLYAPAGAFSPQVIGRVAEQLDDTTASLAKELIRRSVLLATTEGCTVGDDHLERALEQLLSDAEELSRTLLGAQRRGEPLPLGMADLDDADADY